MPQAEGREGTVGGVNSMSKGMGSKVRCKHTRLAGEGEGLQGRIHHRGWRGRWSKATSSAPIRGQTSPAPPRVVGTDV